MRVFPILTALLVVAVLYLMVFEREAVMEFAAAQRPLSAPELPAETEAAPQGAPAATTAGAGTEAASAAAAEPDAVEVVSVVGMHSTARMIDSAVLVRGRTESIRQVDVRAETNGRVVSEPLRKGTFVEEGQLMCRLDIGTRDEALAEAEARLVEARAGLPTAEAAVPEAEARLAEAEARLAEARARLEEAEINERAARQLSEDGFASQTRVKAAVAALESARAGVVSAQSGVQAAKSGIARAQSGLESARAAIQAAEAAVGRARNELERLEIHAPFGGLLESDTAELGTLLQPGSLCATVIQLDPIKLVGFVPEIGVDKVELGALAGARLASGREVTGRVTFLSRSADPNTRTFRVEVEVANPELAIRDGQTVEMAIRADGQPAHKLPQSSLTLDDEGRLGVRIVDAESRARFVPVNVLQDTVEGVFVSGLPEEADVIIVGQEFVTDGVPVAVSFRETAL